jgi:hypothetical protein
MGAIGLPELLILLACPGIAGMIVLVVIVVAQRNKKKREPPR